MATSSSSFSKLLRQSKFATYDPAIKQAYASFGGFSHRGHWGTKRDLPPKRKHKVSDPLVSTSGSRGNARRNPVAFISSLDSAEGQTEWASAEKDVRWIRRLEELGTGVQIRDTGAWSKRVGSFRGRPIGIIDSEFDTADSAQKVEQKTTSALPNVQAMSERRFRSYVARLRTQRQEFHEFLQDCGIGQTQNLDGTLGAPEVIPMYHYAQGTSTHHTRFLAHTNQKAAIQPASRTLTPVPHPSAGLDYLNPNPLMSRLLCPNPVKGRYVENLSRGRNPYPHPQKFEGTSIVSVAGFSANLTASEATNQPIDWQKLVQRDFSQPAERTTGDYRVEKLELWTVPRVVGQSRQNIEGAEIKMHVQDWSKQHEKQANPHRPGSFEYASHEDTRTLDARPTSFKTRMASPAQQSGESLHTSPNAELLDMLDALLAESTANKR
ncbi:ribosomal subunit domain-containing protein [Ceratobasidium sp. AG-Ba]|nr:ribosomal subunit domain-containing protein [Ceratobasidium sp. AG-Ba]QRW08029.1 ribosomal subunit domain-containing protein [Ceratobasidium sp. AG-Ba]